MAFLTSTLHFGLLEVRLACYLADGLEADHPLEAMLAHPFPMRESIYLAEFDFFNCIVDESFEGR